MISNLDLKRKKKKKGVRYIIGHAIFGLSQSMLGMVIFKQTSSLIDQIFCKTICCTTISTSWSLPALVCKLPPILHSVTHKESICYPTLNNKNRTTPQQPDIIPMNYMWYGDIKYYSINVRNAQY